MWYRDRVNQRGCNPMVITIGLHLRWSTRSLYNIGNCIHRVTATLHPWHFSGCIRVGRVCIYAIFRAESAPTWSMCGVFWWMSRHMIPDTGHIACLFFFVSTTRTGTDKQMIYVHALAYYYDGRSMHAYATQTNACGCPFMPAYCEPSGFIA